MYYIKEIAEMFDIPATTIRYYDKEGFFSNLHRGSAGVRQFSDEDIEVLRIVVCLRNAGMQINEIFRFLQLRNKGNSTLAERRKMLIGLTEGLNEKIKATLQGINWIDGILENEITQK